jgi:AraC family transcriptional regulator of adaptative response/methylated-DNA-[protein]-cysteine methyltransferase
MYKKRLIQTPIGDMIAIASDEVLVLLEFADRKTLARQMRPFASNVVEGTNEPLRSIERELSLYFQGKLTAFKTPFLLKGTPFQKSVWKQLLLIPYAQTISYSRLAQNVQKPTALRAAAQAVGANRLAIIVPCHRIIQADGGLGGFAGGVPRKQKLLSLESSR